MADTEVRIRHATDSDLEALTEMDFLQALYHAELDPEGMHLLPQTEYQRLWEPEARKMLAEPDALVLVASERDALRGYLVARVRALPPGVSDPPILFVEDIYVRDDDRGRGLGRLLLEESFRWGRGRGANRVMLEVFDGNPSLGFYQALGFEPHALRLRKAL